MKTSQTIRYWPYSSKPIEGALLDVWADEVALLEEIVLLTGHLPQCPQFTGPYDLGELEPACTCGYDAIQEAKEQP